MRSTGRGKAGIRRTYNSPNSSRSQPNTCFDTKAERSPVSFHHFRKRRKFFDVVVAGSAGSAWRMPARPWRSSLVTALPENILVPAFLLWLPTHLSNRLPGMIQSMLVPLLCNAGRLLTSVGFSRHQSLIKTSNKTLDSSKQFSLSGKHIISNKYFLFILLPYIYNWFLYVHLPYARSQDLNNKRIESRKLFFPRAILRKFV